MRSTKDFIFIVGVSRTGSKFYMQLLNSHPDIWVAPELVYWHPFKKCLERELKKIISNGASVEDICNLVRSIELKDTYSSTIDMLDWQEFSSYLSRIPIITPIDVLKGILIYSSRGEAIVGAKFPVHYSYSSTILRKISGTKLVFLTRDPRDIYCSDILMKTRGLSRLGIIADLIRAIFAPFFVIYTVYRWKANLNEAEKCSRLYGPENVKLFYYEDIAADGSKLVSDLSCFLNVESSKLDVSSVRHVDSSFEGQAASGRSSGKLSFSSRILFAVFAGNSLRGQGYRI